MLGEEAEDVVSAGEEGLAPVHQGVAKAQAGRVYDVNLPAVGDEDSGGIRVVALNGVEEGGAAGRQLEGVRVGAKVQEMVHGIAVGRHRGVVQGGVTPRVAPGGVGWGGGSLEHGQILGAARCVDRRSADKVPPVRGQLLASGATCLDGPLVSSRDGGMEEGDPGLVGRRARAYEDVRPVRGDEADAIVDEPTGGCNGCSGGRLQPAAQGHNVHGLSGLGSLPRPVHGRRGNDIVNDAGPVLAAVEHILERVPAWPLGLGLVWSRCTAWGGRLPA
mmetsp:Transcript_22967/g.45815  ORF Transcript_22967/g.45815 Transcript_22967/m.45815 type:complete len:275 (-) Transcript_22967:199-1023(-)